MKNKLRKVFVVLSCVLSALILVVCMCAFDSDFQNLLILPMLVSIEWLGLAAYANGLLEE